MKLDIDFGIAIQGYPESRDFGIITIYLSNLFCTLLKQYYEFTRAKCNNCIDDESTQKCILLS